MPRSNSSISASFSPSRSAKRSSKFHGLIAMSADVTPAERSFVPNITYSSQPSATPSRSQSRSIGFSVQFRQKSMLSTTVVTPSAWK